MYETYKEQFLIVKRHPLASYKNPINFYMGLLNCLEVKLSKSRKASKEAENLYKSLKERKFPEVEIKEIIKEAVTKTQNADFRQKDQHSMT